MTREQDSEHYGARDPYPENGHDNADQKVVKDGAVNWWPLQFLLVVPVPVVLSAHISNILMDSMSQTLADGSSKIFGKPKSIMWFCKGADLTVILFFQSTRLLL